MLKSKNKSAQKPKMKNEGKSQVEDETGTLKADLPTPDGCVYIEENGK